MARSRPLQCSVSSNRAQLPTRTSLALRPELDMPPCQTLHDSCPPPPPPQHTHTHSYNGGLGGDAYALVADPMAGVFRAEAVQALVASGRVPGSAPTAARLREQLRALGLSHVPTTGPLSVLTVPGGVAGWCALHLRHGRLPWRTVLQPAIDLARHGFTLSRRTADAWGAGVREVIAASRTQFNSTQLNAVSRTTLGHGLSQEALYDFLSVYAPLMAGDRVDGSSDGALRPSPPLAGDRMTNTALAASLSRLGQSGCAAFYGNRGDAQRAMRHASRHGSPATFRPMYDEWRPSWERTLAANVSVDLGRGCETVSIHAPGPTSQAASALPIMQANPSPCSCPCPCPCPCPHPRLKPHSNPYPAANHLGNGAAWAPLPVVQSAAAVGIGGTGRLGGEEEPAALPPHLGEKARVQWSEGAPARRDGRSSRAAGCAVVG